jgi:replicative DNA helicase
LEAGLTRSADIRASYYPLISHMKCPKTISKFAQNILLVYREDYYDRDLNDVPFEVIVAQCKSGKCGIVRLKTLTERKEVVVSFTKIITPPTIAPDITS